MVPTEMLTSMFDEPSSGSKISRYSPRGEWVGMGRGSSISSEASAARLPPHSFASSRISFESTSSVFCASPWTFLVAAPPSPSASAPLFTRVLMPLHARAIVSMSRRRSALMSFLSRWRASRNWLSVMRFMAALFYSLACEPGAAQEERGEQPEHRPHAGHRRKGARGQRNHRVAAVQERGAHADRLALASRRRGLVKERHDD